MHLCQKCRCQKYIDKVCSKWNILQNFPIDSRGQHKPYASIKIAESILFKKGSRYHKNRVGFYYLPHLTNSVNHLKIVEQIGQLFKEILGWSFFKCQVTEKLCLEISKKESDRPFIVDFLHCNLGKKLPKLIALLPIHRLKELLISCDPLKNKGLQQLLRLKIPKLQQIHLQSNQITSDSVRLLGKKPQGLFSNMIIYNQKHFSYNTFMKEGVKSDYSNRKVRTQKRQIVFGTRYTDQSYFYLGFLAKYQRIQRLYHNKKIRITFSFGQLELFLGDTMIDAFIPYFELIE